LLLLLISFEMSMLLKTITLGAGGSGESGGAGGVCPLIFGNVSSSSSSAPENARIGSHS
jgi:hypothetical protein